MFTPLSVKDNTCNKVGVSGRSEQGNYQTVDIMCRKLEHHQPMVKEVGSRE